MPPKFKDRREAGRFLASRLKRFANRPNACVLALPRGGVPVGYEVAVWLNLLLDIVLVRKLGAPGQPELAMGAIATGGVRVFNHEVVLELGLSSETIEAIAATEQRELRRRELLYRGERPPLPVKGRAVIVVDDGLATGATMRAAVLALRQRQASSITVAVPVASMETCEELGSVADEVVCAMTPERFEAVSLWYHQFEQTSDQEVEELLGLAARRWEHAVHQEGGKHLYDERRTTRIFG